MNPKQVKVVCNKVDMRVGIIQKLKLKINLSLHIFFSGIIFYKD